MEPLVPCWKEDEICELIDTLIEVLDGKSDQPKQSERQYFGC